ncbi:hypothetical protein PsYK624_139710 [Phanerochaete sordida]|uniref:Uncharacterized protein n=1 Tax=Phanerochaete sordida TaxID=48140 RepID=A0A9P3LJV7_9APHY|nr:hypothetical protein PsYK624_139710 [Phanerochaete sordida]
MLARRKSCGTPLPELQVQADTSLFSPLKSHRAPPPCNITLPGTSASPYIQGNLFSDYALSSVCMEVKLLERR